MTSDQEIAELKKKLDDQESRISKLEGSSRDEPRQVEKGLSIKEFILEKQPNGYTNTTLAIGFYLENYEGQDCFNFKDLEHGYSLAKERPPQNINDSVNKNIAKGYMTEHKQKKDKRKAWMLTNTGESYVKQSFKRG